ncbi:MAG: hypothetical protein D6730_20940, partial [Bacteroidetes bacterium]
MTTEIPVYMGELPRQLHLADIRGDFVQLAGEPFYCISDYDLMRPFFMSIVSPADHWLFISSNGALTAGRKNPHHALFPYYTDDKIHDSQEITGSKSIFFVHQNGKRYLWEPFSLRMQGIYPVRRNLYKHVMGHKLMFEEINEALQCRFCYVWESSDKYGLVKRSMLHNLGESPLHIELLDGMQNLLPYGVNLSMQTELSTLVDAYKKNELEKSCGLGLYTLSSILVDRPEPSEALKATTVWSAGLPQPLYLLSATQLDNFRNGGSLQEETDVRAERGAYFLHTHLQLEPAEEKSWYMVAEVDQSMNDVALLMKALETPHALLEALKADIEQGSKNLRRIVGSADGLQLTHDRLSNTRHFSNVLFNLMRGGVFDHHYQIDKQDLLNFIRSWNRQVAGRHLAFLQGLPATIQLNELLQRAAQQQDPHLLRLCYEYLPLTFSRRHGDPSRPWNFFSIDIRGEQGEKILNYQGNWRDIFQNWEALCLSYPQFTESIICKFVNASTPDGYNPYRITREGIDWEVTDPADPWSFIGYWGDHQIIYLLKLMEISQNFHPGLLAAFLTEEMFVFANVPYKIRNFKALLADPHHTIDFDEALAKQIEQRVQQTGADGKLLPDQNGQPQRVNLAEKLLLSALTKLSNFIPEGGIWMNTQRPEWNDANNALVGYGVSMVTLCYLRRYLAFCRQLFAQSPKAYFPISEELAQLFDSVYVCFHSHTKLLSGPLSPRQRMNILSELGQAGSRYRRQVYERGFSGKKRQLSLKEVHAFIDICCAFLDHSIRANERPDGLYHSYNLMEVRQDELHIRQLYEMLEGQVAVLSTATLSPAASIRLLAALKSSRLYRQDQNSYLLYPDRQLPRFTEKNIIDPENVRRSALLSRLLQAGDTRIVEQDVARKYHFNGSFRNAADLQAALEGLRQQGVEFTEQEAKEVLDLFEQVFDH